MDWREALTRFFPPRSTWGRQLRRVIARARVDDQGAALATDRTASKRSDRVAARLVGLALALFNEGRIDRKSRAVCWRVSSKALRQGRAMAPGPLAARLGLSSRQLSRYIRALTRAGLVDHHQPPALLRGDWRACVYSLREGPRVIAEAIEAWWAPALARSG